MRNLTLALIAAMAFALLACDAGTTQTSAQPTAQPTATQGSSVSATLNLGNGNFVGNTNLTIKVGQVLTIVDPLSGGGPHWLAMGQDAQFQAEDGAPDAMNQPNGVAFNAGDTKTFTFSKPGTYYIMCTVHPIMNATITVTP